MTYNVTVWEQGSTMCRLVTHLYVGDVGQLLEHPKIIRVVDIQEAKTPTVAEVTGNGRWGCE